MAAQCTIGDERAKLQERIKTCERAIRPERTMTFERLI